MGIYRYGFVLLLLTSLLLSACGGGSPNGEAGAAELDSPKLARELTDTWKFDRTIEAPIEKEVSGNAVVLGDFETHGIEITIPEGAFSVPVTVTLSQPETEIKYNGSAMEPEGVPASFIISGEQLRSDLPMVVKVRVGKTQFQEMEETGGFRGTHYDETMGWSYLTALEVNQDHGYVVFEAYHNFLFGTAKLTREERMEEYAKEKALDTWGMQQMGDEVENVTREMIREIMIQQFNTSNESEIAKIADAVMSEIDSSALDYGKMALQLKNGDLSGLTESVAGKLGSTLADSMKSGTLETLFGQAGTAAAAAGHLWEGDYSGAGMKIAEAIAETSPVYRVAKVWVDVVDTRISNWRNDEVEKAYKIYINGSQSRVPWGYNVEAGDFEDLYSQMRGVSRQLELEAVERYASARGISTSDISSDRRQEILRDVKENLKQQFEARAKQEEELRKLEEDQREIIQQFEKWGLLQEGRSWYPYDTPIENMLHRLHGQIERIMKEIGRYDLVIRPGDLHDQSRGLDNIGELKDSEILVPHLAELINTRYVFGEEEYQKKLIELGYMALSLQAGTYNGSLVVTDTPVVKALKQSLANPASVPEYSGSDSQTSEMCEEINFSSAEVQQSIREAIDQAESIIGKSVPLQIIITKEEGNQNYSAMVKADFDSSFPEMGCEEVSGNTPFKVHVENERITLTHALDEGDAQWVYDGTVSAGGKLQGTMRLRTNELDYRNYVGTDNFLTGTWEVQKQ